MEQPLLNHDSQEHAGTAHPPSEHSSHTSGAPPWPKPTPASRLTFSWLQPLLSRGAQHQLHPDDLPPIQPADLLPERCSEKLCTEWAREVARAEAARRRGSHRHVQPSLLAAIVRAFGAPYFALGFLKLVNDALSFVAPVLLNGLLQHLSTQPAASQQGGRAALLWRRADVKSTAFGTWCAALLTGSLLLKAFCTSHYNSQQGITANRLRAAIACIVFRQTLELNAASLSAVGSGRVQTLMSVDAEQLVALCVGFHELWSLPLQIGVALWLLYTQVQFAFLAGLDIVILIIPLNKLLANAIQAASVKMMAAKDQRVGVMMETLRGVRQIKAATWELHLRRVQLLHEPANCRRWL